MSLTSQIGYYPLEPFERDTLTKVFFGAIDRKRSSQAFLFKREGRWQAMTHADVERQVVALAAALDVLGVEAGDRVAILSENSAEWALTDFAVLGLGAIDVPLYPTLPAGQLAFILGDCGARVVLVSDAEQLEKVQSLREQVPSIEHVVVFDSAAAGPGVLRFQELVEMGQRRVEQGQWSGFRDRALSIERDAVATVIYTSGTTGAPKGVMLTHYNLAAMVAATRQHGSVPMGPGDVALSMLPLSHVFERAVDYYYWDCDATIAYASSIKNVAEDLREARPHAMVSVPRLFEKIYHHVMSTRGPKQHIVQWATRTGGAWVEAKLNGRSPGAGLKLQYTLADRLVFSKIRAQVGGRMRTFICGGAPLAEEITRFFHAAGLPIHEGYGLTETSPVLTANRPGAVRFGTVGVPYPGVALRLTEAGEILTRSPFVMKGYWNLPEPTHEVIDDEGWFHTGDIGSFDADGFLRITDRLKDLIVTAGGKNIAPQPIEQHATASPFISQAVMIGDRRPYPILLVVPDWDRLAQWAREQGVAFQDRWQAVRDARIQEFLEKEVLGRLDGFARFELPKKLSLLAEEFTVELGMLTPTLKVKRRAVEQYYRQLIEQIYSDSRTMLLGPV